MTNPFSIIPFIAEKDIFDRFDRIFGNKFNFPSTDFSGEWSPRADIKEKDNQFIIEVDIPGVDPKNIQISIDENTIQIQGEKESEHKKEAKNYLQVERSYGKFLRTITLPHTADLNNIKAKSKNGVLEITIPKAQKSASRKIEVKEE